MKKLILKAASQAPTAGCQQLYTILDITDQKIAAHRKLRPSAVVRKHRWYLVPQLIVKKCSMIQCWKQRWSQENQALGI